MTSHPTWFLRQTRINHCEGLSLPYTMAFHQKHELTTHPRIWNVVQTNIFRRKSKTFFLHKMNTLHNSTEMVPFQFELSGWRNCKIQTGLSKVISLDPSKWFCFLSHQKANACTVQKVHPHQRRIRLVRNYRTNLVWICPQNHFYGSERIGGQIAIQVWMTSQATEHWFNVWANSPIRLGI